MANRPYPRNTPQNAAADTASPRAAEIARCSCQLPCRFPPQKFVPYEGAGSSAPTPTSGATATNLRIPQVPTGNKTPSAPARKAAKAVAYSFRKSRLRSNASTRAHLFCAATVGDICRRSSLVNGESYQRWARMACTHMTVLCATWRMPAAVRSLNSRVDVTKSTKATWVSSSNPCGRANVSETDWGKAHRRGRNGQAATP